MCYATLIYKAENSICDKSWHGGNVLHKSVYIFSGQEQNVKTGVYLKCTQILEKNDGWTVEIMIAEHATHC